MWKFYNLLTESNKSSYIDSFLDRSLTATEIAKGINNALHGDEQIKRDEEEVQVKGEEFLLPFP